ncbi:ABC transporter ATP-binding protein [Priestia endophytica]|jgi:ABC-2 type transport system ATP-binding protein|uniref:ABC-2 type transport system ATP-binding protein n=1 Tax=Priestia endophytica DSM 13796 TaxID=1121089 RepID=A0A1I6BYP3_9BACI|nr:ABC transporter ATP-binding protein [Priestia endophytica]KAB2493383.1 ABC transporter ATP-binding protein [Priestia endophytica]KYG33211.1 antibiotic ABC transporter ATP-binding protein [Priestia endophytica]MBG9814257.1 antibiotic ABC transporter ATP-binding protein [Priestia endophytica]RAS80236.1 export ABC transporter ATP-binding protein [Priestia endophytica]SFQ86056.1 ABC-2 type transport system ATP-binding protein [Priestia endophytica DSM 13796]
MNVLELRNVTRKFNDFIAVDNMSLSIQKGEIFGLLGANGAGKSTTINMIASLLQITEGEIEILGKSITKHRKFAKMNVGIVPQDIAIYENLTASENIKFFAGLYGLRGSLLKQRVEEALEFVGLADKAKSFPKSFSGGMKRRLNIACAIAHRPKLLIMDEPTVGIDPQSRKHILESVKKLNEIGSTIIYTSHYMEEVEALCTNIAIVDHGKIIAKGSKENLKSLITDVKELWVEVKDPLYVNCESIEEIGGVKRASIEGNIIKIYSDVEIQNLNKIIQTLLKAEVEISSLEEKAPNLETVFLTLTGRNLRD